MKKETSPVRALGAVVGVAEYEVFDSTSEAVAQLGEATVLELINTQHKTNTMNALRQQHSKPTKSYFEEKAFGLITPDEFNTIAGDPTRIRALVKAKAEALEAEWTKSRAVPAAEGEA